MRVLILPLLFGGCLAGKENRVEYVGRLKGDLFKDYDNELIPMMDDKPVILSVGMNMVKMDLTDKGELDFTAWIILSWTDARLAWDPKEYHDVTVLRIPPSRVWVPDVEIYNSVEYGPGYFSDIMAKKRGIVLVYSSGMVLYIPPVNAKINCNDEEFADWPWGEYDCSLKIGSWTFDGNMLNLTKYQNADFISNENLDVNSPVVFTADSFKEEPLQSKYYKCCPNEPYPSLEYKFKVQRSYRITPAGRENNPNPAAQLPPADFDI